MNMKVPANNIVKYEDIEIRAEWTEASSPILWRMVGDEDWKPTPYQVADAGHRWGDACDMVGKWLDAQS